MRVTYSGVIAASASDVWERLIDVETVLLLLPGASLQREGDRVVGSLKVRPTSQVTYRITARASCAAEGDTSATIAVTGSEARGAGTLAATVVVAVRDEDGGSGLAATADIEATGRGAEADEYGWSRVLSRLGTAIVASFERHPAGTSVPRPGDPAAAAAGTESASAAPVAPPPVVTEPEAEPSDAEPSDAEPSDAEPVAAEPAPRPLPPSEPRVVPAAAPVAAPSKAPLIVGGIVVLLLIRWLLKRRG